MKSKVGNENNSLRSPHFNVRRVALSLMSFAAMLREHNSFDNGCSK